MREIRVVIVDPFIERYLKIKRIIPVIAPGYILLNGAYDALGVRIAFGV